MGFWLLRPMECGGRNAMWPLRLVIKDHAPELPYQKWDYHNGEATLTDSSNWLQPTSHTGEKRSHLGIGPSSPSPSSPLPSEAPDLTIQWNMGKWSTNVLSEFLDEILCHNKTSSRMMLVWCKRLTPEFWETAITFSGNLKANSGRAIKKLQFNKWY